MKYAVIIPTLNVFVNSHRYRHEFPQNCLEQYHGTFGRHSVLVADEHCVHDLQISRPPITAFWTVTPLEDGISDLIWVAERAVEDSLRNHTEEQDLNAFVKSVTNQRTFYDIAGSQQILGHGDSIQVLYANGKNALLATKGSHHIASVIDDHLPRFYKPTLLSTTPISYIPVPSEAVDHVRSVLAGLKYDSTVDAIVNNISVPQMYNDIQFLTGEDGKSGIESRHSFSEGILVAAEWIAARINATGAECEQRRFLYGFGPNVICRYPSTVNTSATVLLSAHYDSRGSFGSTRAPGADDDGSGTTAILALARTIARLGLTFKQNVELVLFAGEEQGLYGSRYYARDLREADANITLMIQADMLAYHKPGEPAQLGLPDKIGTPEVTELVSKISALYSPELTVGYTSACCSDHQSFYEQGFPSSQVFERAGPIADPMYHNSGDLSDREGYDLEQVKLIAKVQLATLLHTAGFDLPK